MPTGTLPEVLTFNMAELCRFVSHPTTSTDVNPQLEGCGGVF
jgi:hypothetical protein